MKGWQNDGLLLGTSGRIMMPKRAHKFGNLANNPYMTPSFHFMLQLIRQYSSEPTTLNPFASGLAHSQKDLRPRPGSDQPEAARVAHNPQS